MEYLVKTRNSSKASYGSSTGGVVGRGVEEVGAVVGLDVVCVTPRGGTDGGADILLRQTFQLFKAMCWKTKSFS